MMFRKPEQEALKARYGKSYLEEVQRPFNEIMRHEFNRDQSTAWDILLMSPGSLARVDRILGKKEKA